ncbi:MAG: hypothetical protein GF320_00415 [Armatimonadia bacterium]|nr:hypothetical protein [Armatimonadia bacterium]
MDGALRNTKNRRLFFDTALRSTRRAYICDHDEVVLGEVYSHLDIVTRAPELALDAAQRVFDQFNWTGVPRSILADDQARLLERRLGT